MKPSEKKALKDLVEEIRKSYGVTNREVFADDLLCLIESFEVEGECKVMDDYIFCPKCGYMASQLGEKYNCSQCEWSGLPEPPKGTET